MRSLRADTASTPELAERPATALSAEYRHFGDDSALLTVAVQAHAAALPGEARLICPDGRAVPASAVTFQPEAGLARLVFAVDRGVASAAGASLHVAIGDQLVVTVPEPVKRIAIGVPDAELDHAVAAGVAGDELAGLLRVLERRATIAERVAGDAREERSDATKLAQAYREIWEVRELFESREEAYRQSAERVDAAAAAQRDAEAHVAEARAELADVRAESQAATARLEEQLAEREAELAAVRAAGEELTKERDEALAGRDGANAARDEAVARSEDAAAAQELAEAERDAALVERDDLTAERDEVAAQRDEALAAADHAEVARAEALAERDAALHKLQVVKSDLAAATADVAGWVAELEEARTRAGDAEALLEAERTLHEARLASRAGTERNLGDLFAEAQRERLRQTPEDDQRAQVEALERQLARMKQPGPGPTG